MAELYFIVSFIKLFLSGNFFWEKISKSTRRYRIPRFRKVKRENKCVGGRTAKRERERERLFKFKLTTDNTENKINVQFQNRARISSVA